MTTNTESKGLPKPGGEVDDGTLGEGEGVDDAVIGIDCCRTPRIATTIPTSDCS